MGDMDKCSYDKIKDKNLTTWGNTVYRRCRSIAKKDGYCALHHPENIEASINSACLHEAVEEKRKIQQLEEAVVGKFLRLKNPSEFMGIISYIKEAEDLAKDLR